MKSSSDHINRMLREALPCSLGEVQRNPGYGAIESKPKSSQSAWDKRTGTCLTLRRYIHFHKGGHITFKFNHNLVFTN